MNKYLLTQQLGEFFSKMYDANKGEDIDITLRLNDRTIQVYNKTVHVNAFEYITLVDEATDLDTLVKSLSI